MKEALQTALEALTQICKTELENYADEIAACERGKFYDDVKQYESELTAYLRALEHAGVITEIQRLAVRKYVLNMAKEKAKEI